MSKNQINENLFKDDLKYSDEFENETLRKQIEDEIRESIGIEVSDRLLQLKQLSFQVKQYQKYFFPSTFMNKLVQFEDDLNAEIRNEIRDNLFVCLLACIFCCDIQSSACSYYICPIHLCYFFGNFM